MGAGKRFRTKYPGVYYREKRRVHGTGTERVYYVVYRVQRDGRWVTVEEKVGRQYADDMTPARASRIRGEILEGKRKPARVRRQEIREQNERWTIRRLWEEYKAHHPGLKGIVTDENRFQKHINPELGDREPRELLPLDVERLKRKLRVQGGRRGEPLKPATVRNVLELLRRIINFGVQKQLCEPLKFRIGSRRSGASVTMPELNNEKTEDLSPEQLRRLLDVLEEWDNVQVANMMKMVLFTGMRRGELFRLKWDDIDFARGHIWIRDPKGGKDQSIPLNDEARALLESHPRPFPNSPYVFPGKNGQRRVEVNRAARAIVKAAGLPPGFRPFHGLRHVYASMLASSGEVDLYTLQRLLTHKSPMMTQRYAHLRDEALARAAQLAGDLVGSIRKGFEAGETVEK